jgi:hypothetical protein
MKKLQNNFTTPEQSKRLLELGVPAGSADCYYTQEEIEGNMFWFDLHIKREYQPHTSLHASIIWGEILPCWSAGRLIEISKLCYVSLCEHDYFIRQKDCNTDFLIKMFELGIDIMDFSKLEE